MSGLKYRFTIDDIQNRTYGYQLPDMSVLFYGKGRYDNYCLYKGRLLWDGNSQSFTTLCTAITDDYYYDILKTMNDRYGSELVYERILCRLYNVVTPYFQMDVLERLRAWIDKSGIHQIEDRDLLFEACCMVYYGMVAEENHGLPNQPPVCGKVLKMYALHLLLIQGVPIGTTGNPGVCQMLQGQSPQVINQKAAELGIFRQAVVLYL